MPLISNNINDLLLPDGSRNFKGILVDYIPKELKDFKQWSTWKYYFKKGKKKPNKLPIQANGEIAKSNTPSTWWSYRDIGFHMMKDKRNRLEGFMFMHTKESGIIGVDLDNCINEAGVLNDFAINIINMLDSYTEVTPSGKGIRIFIRGTIPSNMQTEEIEIYTELKALTVTGHKIHGEHIINRDKEINKLYERYRPIKIDNDYSNKNYIRNSNKTYDDVVRVINSNSNLLETYRGKKYLGADAERWSCLSMLYRICDNDIHLVESLYIDSPVYSDYQERYKSEKRCGKTLLQYELDRLVKRN
jgi:primase-polymerase (primpol)-like protein